MMASDNFTEIFDVKNYRLAIIWHCFHGDIWSHFDKHRLVANRLRDGWTHTYTALIYNWVVK